MPKKIDKKKLKKNKLKEVTSKKKLDKKKKKSKIVEMPAKPKYTKWSDVPQKNSSEKLAKIKAKATEDIKLQMPKAQSTKKQSVSASKTTEELQEIAANVVKDLTPSLRAVSGFDNTNLVPHGVEIYIGPLELIELERHGYITAQELRDRLGFAGPTPKKNVAETPLEIRQLVDGSLEHLFKGGRRLIIPKTELDVKTFAELPAPWHTIGFSETPTEDEDDVTEVFEKAEKNGTLGRGTLAKRQKDADVVDNPEEDEEEDHIDAEPSDIDLDDVEDNDDVEDDGYNEESDTYDDGEDEEEEN